MSLETWKQEFYPVDADSPEVQDNYRETVFHSLRKWQGVLKENCEKHGIEYKYFAIYEFGAKKFGFGDAHCSLCHSFLLVGTNCEKCPILKFSGVPCYERKSIYAKCEFNPQPMIDVLEKILNNIDKENK